MSFFFHDKLCHRAAYYYYKPKQKFRLSSALCYEELCRFIATNEKLKYNPDSPVWLLHPRVWRFCHKTSDTKTLLIDVNMNKALEPPYVSNEVLSDGLGSKAGSKTLSAIEIGGLHCNFPKQSDKHSHFTQWWQWSFFSFFIQLLLSHVEWMTKCNNINKDRPSEGVHCYPHLYD